jgi:hypothetical protein
MSLLTQQFTGEEASKAMLEGLTSRIRSELKAIILARIEPDVDAAVEAGLEGLKAAIHSYREHSQMRDVVKVIIERKDKA